MIHKDDLVNQWIWGFPLESGQWCEFLDLFLPAAVPEAPAPVEDTVTSPVKNLQKKTDLFQLQKVFYHF